MSKGRFFSNVNIIIIAFFAIMAPIFNYAERIGYVFVDNVTFTGFNKLILFIMIINAVAMLYFAYNAVKKYQPITSGGKRFLKISFGLTIFFNLINLIYIIMSPSDLIVYMLYFWRELPYILIVFGALFLLFVYPDLKKGLRAGLVSAIIVSLMLVICIPVFHIFVFRFDSAPAVFDNGSEFTVVWATNDTATGYVEYSYGGENYKVFDSDGGKIITDKIHSVTLPYEHLRGNSYRVCSMRVIDELGYGGTNGKTLVSSYYSFSEEITEDLEILCVSDWHLHNKAMYAASDKLSDPDMVIMLGDATNAMYCLEDIIDYIIAPAGELSGSSVPVLFVRGNHDTRGEYAAGIAGYLGYDSYYYQKTIGDYNFTILDSAEDKDDDHPEYGGLADFEAYADVQTEWLEGLTPTDGTGLDIVLCHDSLFHFDEDIALTRETEAIRLGTDLMISGHSHNSLINTEEHPFPYLLDGGWTENSKGRRVFIATSIKLNQNKVDVYSIDNKGEVYLNEEDILG
jgi:predicted phosphodiesterase